MTSPKANKEVPTFKKLTARGSYELCGAILAVCRKGNDGCAVYDSGWNDERIFFENKDKIEHLNNTQVVAHKRHSVCGPLRKVKPKPKPKPEPKSEPELVGDHILHWMHLLEEKLAQQAEAIRYANRRLRALEYWVSHFDEAAWAQAQAQADTLLDFDHSNS